MNRSRVVFFVLSLIVVSSLVGGHWLADAVNQRPGQDSLYKYLSTFTEVLGLVRQAYVDETDLDALMAGALDGTTEALDPFSVYVPAGEVEPFLAARETGNRLSGVTLLKERGIAYVVAVEANSPADQAGVRPGDVVSKIAGSNTRLLPVWEIQEALAGEPGSHVELELLRQGEELQVAFELTPYETPVASLEALERDGDTAALVQIARFEAGTPERVAALLGEVREAGHDRLLLDLRNVAGGEAEAAYGVAALLAGGELGKLVKREHTLETFQGGEDGWSGRLVVMINRGTLGAAEVLATILRQRLGAELVGERTFGYAGRQDVAELTGGGRLLYTDAFYTGPDGVPLRESLEPDESVDFFSRNFEERDVPNHELIYRRGVERVFRDAAEEDTPLEQAA